MGHQLDQTGETTFFADSRTDAWHGLGQSVGGLMTAGEALDASHLSGWDVRKQPIFTAGADGSLINVDDKFATVRTNPITQAVEPLGVVGNGYHVLQNEESTRMLNALVDEGGAHFETAGSLRGGRETFVTMKLPQAMVLDVPGGQDRTDLYLAALNSHDGGSAYRMIVTPVRIVCANTQIAALAAAKSSWSIRHTSGAADTLAEARASLNLTWRYVAGFEDAAKRMIDAEIDRLEAKRLLDQVFSVNHAATQRQADTRSEHVHGVLAGLDNETNRMLGDTRYGVYNSVTEYVDHKWPVRGNGEMLGVAPEKALRGPFAALKSRAFELLSV